MRFIKFSFYTLILILLVMPGWATNKNNTPLVPALLAKDVIQIDNYRQATFGGVEITVYQIMNLGYSSVADFQQSYNLKVDSIIGPQTQRKARELYIKKYGAHPSEAGIGHLFSFQGQVVTKDGKPCLKITLTNTSKSPIRFVGRLCYDDEGNFILKNSNISIATGFCSKQANGIISCGKAYFPCGEIPVGTELKPNESFSITKSAPSFVLDKSKRWWPHIEYFDQTLRKCWTRSN